MNSVAGFKAVDAEGNELGIMSLADITAAVKESIMQDAAMARSVATLSEASTLAASDTYEDKLCGRTACYIIPKIYGEQRENNISS